MHGVQITFHEFYLFAADNLYPYRYQYLCEFFLTHIDLQQVTRPEISVNLFNNQQSSAPSGSWGTRIERTVSLT